jgi:glycosyltransferase involved in cell wall biosynthesis
MYKGRQLFNQYIKKYGLPDLIHAHNGIYAGILAQDLSINAGINSGSAAIPYVITEHSSWILKSHYQGQVKLLLEQAYQQANAVIAVSESLASKIKFDFCVSEVLVVPNIIPSEFQHYSGSIATRAEKETSSEKDTCYIHVASLDHNKNQQLLLESFREILALKPMAWLRIIGDGPNKALLVAMAHRLGITHRVEFLGALPRKEVASYLLMSDVFLLSSLVETFGVVAIEANAMGLPVVSTPCGGIADIIESGVNGVLCKDFTVESYVACIREADGLLLEVDKSQVRLATLTKFGPATVARSLAGIYQSVMSE